MILPILNAVGLLFASMVASAIKWWFVGMPTSCILGLLALEEINRAGEEHKQKFLKKHMEDAK